MSSCYRIALLSDIHGNRPAFEPVLRDLDRHAPLDAILVAGDIIGGPHQQEVLQRLLDLRAVMIQGNNEHGAVRLADGSAPDYFYTAKSYSMARWVREHLSAEQVIFLRALPEQRVFTLPGAGAIRVVHGSPRDVSELVFPDRAAARQNHLNHPVVLEDIIGLVSEPVIVLGHTHLQFQIRRGGTVPVPEAAPERRGGTVPVPEAAPERRGGLLAVNPGAVSFPQNGYLGAQYALLDWDGRQWNPSFYQVPYDLEQIRCDYQESGFLEASPLARAILQSILTGKDFLPPFFAHARRIAQEAGRGDLPYFPDEVWEAADRTFAWKV